MPPLPPDPDNDELAREERAALAHDELAREERAALAHDEFRLLVESVTEYAIFMLDATGHVATWNSGAVRLKGYRADEIVGRHFACFYTDDDVACGKPDAELARAAASGQVHEEGWRVRKDGSRFWADVVLSVVRRGDGSLRGFAKVTRDLTERREAERARADERKRQWLGSVIDTMTVSVAVCDARGVVVHMNDAARQLAPSLVSASGQSLGEAFTGCGIFLPDGVTPFPVGEGAMARALRGEPSDSVEAVIRNAAHPGGVVISTDARPMRDASGAITGAVTVSHDITARKRTENELRNQKALLQSILDTLDEAVTVHSVTRELRLANPASERLFGAPAAYELLTPDGATRLSPEEEPTTRALRGETVNDLEVLVRSAPHLAGILVATAAKPLFDDRGAIVGAVTTSRDISARKRAETQLADHARLLHSILDGMAETVSFYDRNGAIILTNPAHQRQYGGVAPGTTVQEMMQQFGVFSPDGGRRLTAADALTTRALRGEAMEDCELLIKTPTHPEGRLVSSHAKPVRDAADAIVGVVVTGRDITPQKRAEAANRSLIEKLRRSNLELDQFAYVASHDLRAPLRAIETLSDWICEDLGPALAGDAKDHMQLLRARVRRMDTLLVDMLEYARASKFKAEVVTIDFAELAWEVTELASPPVGFSVVADEVHLPLVTAALPLKRVLINLVTNAIKHHDRKEGVVRISVCEREGFWEFAVSDDGPGIAPAFHERIFQMFQTLRSRDVVEGSGIGLALVKKIVEEAGGEVGVASPGPDGRGSTFRFTWPTRWPTPEETRA